MINKVICKIKKHNKNVVIFPNAIDPKEAQFTAIERALDKIKAAGGHCYELLSLFWYHKKTMKELTELFGYSNADNTKQQKAKCQKRLEKIAYNELHK